MMTTQDQRPTSLLHDGWGSPRPVSDAEIARGRRMGIIHDTVLGVIMLGMMSGIVMLIVWLLMLL